MNSVADGWHKASGISSKKTGAGANGGGSQRGPLRLAAPRSIRREFRKKGPAKAHHCRRKRSASCMASRRPKRNRDAQKLVCTAATAPLPRARSFSLSLCLSLSLSLSLSHGTPLCMLARRIRAHKFELAVSPDRVEINRAASRPQLRDTIPSPELPCPNALCSRSLHCPRSAVKGPPVAVPGR